MPFSSTENTEETQRVLLYATTAYMIDKFNRRNIRILQHQGYEVHVACNFQTGNPVSGEHLARFRKELMEMGLVCHHLPLTRNILDLRRNGKAFAESVRILREAPFRFVHCHTPVGAAIARMACRITHTPVIYTAHGFHFFTGAPWLHWALYYPVEKLLSRATDLLITINEEDCERARAKFHMKKLAYVPGIGVDTERYRGAEDCREGQTGRLETRRRFHIPDDAFLFLSVGELSRRKNHLEAIRALEKLKDPSWRYLIAGTGRCKGQIQAYLREHGLEDRVMLADYSDDVCALYQAADAFLFPSLQEGLPAALMEAMACELPCVASDIRGNRDLLDAGGGYLYRDAGQLQTALRQMMLLDEGARRRMGRHNRERICADFSAPVVDAQMTELYGTFAQPDKHGNE